MTMRAPGLGLADMLAVRRNRTADGVPAGQVVVPGRLVILTGAGEASLY